MGRESYERELRERQRRHLEKVNEHHWRPCAHDACGQCHGTGIKSNGTSCVHGISCSCPKCSPFSMMAVQHPLTRG